MLKYSKTRQLWGVNTFWKHCIFYMYPVAYRNFYQQRLDQKTARTETPLTDASRLNMLIRGRRKTYYNQEELFYLSKNKSLLEPSRLLHFHALFAVI